MSKNKATRRSFWLSVTRAHRMMEVLTIDAGGETVLPVFSFQEEGEFFLSLEAAEADWRLRETTTGELVSLLLGLCARVNKVALDPLPSLGEREIIGLVSTGRRRFIRHLMGEDTAHSERDKASGHETGCYASTRLRKDRTRHAQSAARQRNLSTIAEGG